MHHPESETFFRVIEESKRRTDGQPTIVSAPDRDLLIGRAWRLFDEVKLDASHLQRSIREKRGFELTALWLERVDVVPAAAAEWVCPMCLAAPGQACDFDDYFRREDPDALFAVAPAPREGESHGRRGFDRDFLFGRAFDEDTPHRELQWCAPETQSLMGFSRACCPGCEKRGPLRNTTKEAMADFLDDHWPAWRQLPLLNVPEQAFDQEKIRRTLEKWLLSVVQVMPTWWLNAFEQMAQSRAGRGPLVLAPPLRSSFKSSMPMRIRHSLGGCLEVPGGAGYEPNLPKVDTATAEQRRYANEVAGLLSLPAAWSITTTTYVKPGPPVTDRSIVSSTSQGQPLLF